LGEKKRDCGEKKWAYKKIDNKVNLKTPGGRQGRRVPPGRGKGESGGKRGRGGEEEIHLENKQSALDRKLSTTPRGRKKRGMASKDSMNREKGSGGGGSRSTSKQDIRPHYRKGNQSSISCAPGKTKREGVS